MKKAFSLFLVCSLFVVGGLLLFSSSPAHAAAHTHLERADLNPNYMGVAIDADSSKNSWHAQCVPAPTGSSKVGTVEDYQQTEATTGVHNRCEDSPFYYALTTAGHSTFTASWAFQADSKLENPVCDVVAYIPAHNAGARHAQYKFTVTNSNFEAVQLSNPTMPSGGYDQEITDSTDGVWLEIASALDLQGNHTFLVSMNNEDDTQPGWYIAASSMAVSCR